METGKIQVLHYSMAFSKKGVVPTYPVCFFVKKLEAKKKVSPTLFDIRVLAETQFVCFSALSLYKVMYMIVAANMLNIKRN